MKTYYYLYKTTNLSNGKCYIGVHKTKNLDDGYIGSGKYLKNAINKYGIENFEKEIIKFFETEDKMWQEEVETINENFVKDKNNYNLRCGGFGGWDYINENDIADTLKGRRAADIKLEKKYGSNWRSVISKMGKHILKEKYGEDFYKNIGKKSTESLRKKYKDGGWTFSGRTHTEQTKKKISQSSSIHQKGEKNSNYGKCWIYNNKLKKNKSIPKEELEDWIKEGWKRGRKMGFSK